MPRHDKDQLKSSLTIEDIKKLLYELGVSDINDNETKQELITNTVCHNESDGSHKLHYYYDSEHPTFHCYTGCSCSMDIFELVRRNYALRNIELSFTDTVNWVAERSGRSFGFGFSVNTEDRSSRNEEMDWLNRFKKKEKVEPPILREYSDRILNVFEDYHHPNFLEDNISREAMSKFNIMFYAKTNSVIIPHYNINGKIIGIRSRNLNQWDIDSGYKYIPTRIQGHTFSFPTYCSLFGLHQNKNVIQRLRKIVIFESEKSVLQCESYWPNSNFSTALSGRNISQLQIEMILELGVEEVIIATDRMFKDPDSRLAEIDTEYILRMGRKFTPYVRTYTIFDTEGLVEYRDSPSDAGKESLIKLMQGKQEILNRE